MSAGSLGWGLVANYSRGLGSQFTTGQPGIHDLLQSLWFRREMGQGVLPGVPILRRGLELAGFKSD